MAQQSVCSTSEDVGICATDSRICHSRSAGTELEKAGGKIEQSDHGGSTAEGSRRFLGYLLEGMHVNELKAAKGKLTNLFLAVGD